MNDDRANSCRSCMFHTTDPRFTTCPTCPGNPPLIVRLAATETPVAAPARCPGCGNPPAEPTVVSVGFTWHLGCYTAKQQPAPQLVGVNTGYPQPPTTLWTPEPWRRW